MASIIQGRVCILGAGGPVGAVIYKKFKKTKYVLRLVDNKPLKEIINLQNKIKHVPKITSIEKPHEWIVADISSYEQILSVLDGCDGVINLTVNRDEVDIAFEVNVIGAFNLMRASIEKNIKRIIQTGPATVHPRFEGDYYYDYHIPDETPSRPGTDLYPLTKNLGSDIINAFALEYPELDVITFLLSRLRYANRKDGRDDDVVIAYSTAWEDLGEAFLCGFKSEEKMEANEIFHICGNLPMSKYNSKKAGKLLGWYPKHNFSKFYSLYKNNGR
jgi:nucleoside-diphosphate-sugar epimerase